MANIRIEGMDRLQRKLKDLGRKAQELDGEHPSAQVPSWKERHQINVGASVPGGEPALALDR